MRKIIALAVTALALVAVPTASAKSPRAYAAHLSPTYNYCTGYDYYTGAQTWAGSLRGGGSLAPDNDVKQLWDDMERILNINIVSSWAGYQWSYIGDHYLYGDWKFLRANGLIYTRRMYCKDARSTGGHYTDGRVDGP